MVTLGLEDESVNSPPSLFFRFGSSLRHIIGPVCRKKQQGGREAVGFVRSYWAHAVTADRRRRKRVRVDIRGGLAERMHRLDLAYIRSVLTMLEQALGLSDLLPVLESAIAR